MVERRRESRADEETRERPATRRERARAIFESVNGFPAPEPTDFFQEAALDHVFGDLWSRPGLSRKERRWITLSVIAMSGAETAMGVHVRAALETGDITLDEMEEFVAHFAHYAGFPIAATFHAALRRIAAELSAGSTGADDSE